MYPQKTARAPVWGPHDRRRSSRRAPSKTCGTRARKARGTGRRRAREGPAATWTNNYMEPPPRSYTRRGGPGRLADDRCDMRGSWSTSQTTPGAHLRTAPRRPAAPASRGVWHLRHGPSFLCPPLSACLGIAKEIIMCQ